MVTAVQALKDKYLKDPDIIPPKGKTKDDVVEELVTQKIRQSRNNSRAFELMNKEMESADGYAWDKDDPQKPWEDKKGPKFEIAKESPDKYGDPSISHLRVMHRPLKVLPGSADDYKVDDPPEIDSDEIKTGLGRIKRAKGFLEDRPELNDDISDQDEDVLHPFLEYAEENDLKVDEQYLENLMADVSTIAMYLKYKHNMPRPWQYEGGDEPKDTETDTPSYPSGHSTQAKVAAEVLAGSYPEHKQQFEDIGESVGLNRIVAGWHFPVDHSSGRDLADQILEKLPKNTDMYLKKSGLLEDDYMSAIKSAMDKHADDFNVPTNMFKSLLRKGAKDLEAAVQHLTDAKIFAEPYSALRGVGGGFVRETGDSPAHTWLTQHLGLTENTPRNEVYNTVRQFLSYHNSLPEHIRKIPIPGGGGAVDAHLAAYEHYLSGGSAEPEDEESEQVKTLNEAAVALVEASVFPTDRIAGGFLDQQAKDLGIDLREASPEVLTQAVQNWKDFHKDKGFDEPIKGRETGNPNYTSDMISDMNEWVDAGGLGKPETASDAASRMGMSRELQRIRTIKPGTPGYRGDRSRKADEGVIRQLGVPVGREAEPYSAEEEKVDRARAKELGISYEDYARDKWTALGRSAPGSVKERFGYTEQPRGTEGSGKKIDEPPSSRPVPRVPPVRFGDPPKNIGGLDYKTDAKGTISIKNTEANRISLSGIFSRNLDQATRTARSRELPSKATLVNRGMPEDDPDYAKEIDRRRTAYFKYVTHKYPQHTQQSDPKSIWRTEDGEEVERGTLDEEALKKATYVSGGEEKQGGRRQTILKRAYDGFEVDTPAIEEKRDANDVITQRGRDATWKRSSDVPVEVPADERSDNAVELLNENGKPYDPPRYGEPREKSDDLIEHEKEQLYQEAVKDVPDLIHINNGYNRAQDIDPDWKIDAPSVDPDLSKVPDADSLYDRLGTEGFTSEAIAESGGAVPLPPQTAAERLAEAQAAREAERSPDYVPPDERPDSSPHMLLTRGEALWLSARSAFWDKNERLRYPKIPTRMPVDTFDAAVRLAQLRSSPRFDHGSFGTNANHYLAMMALMTGDSEEAKDALSREKEELKKTHDPDMPDDNIPSDKDIDVDTNDINDQKDFEEQEDKNKKTDAETNAEKNEIDKNPNLTNKQKNARKKKADSKGKARKSNRAKKSTRKDAADEVAKGERDQRVPDGEIHEGLLDRVESDISSEEGTVPPSEEELAERTAGDFTPTSQEEAEMEESKVRERFKQAKINTQARKLVNRGVVENASAGRGLVSGLFDAYVEKFEAENKKDFDINARGALSGLGQDIIDYYKHEAMGSKLLQTDHLNDHIKNIHNSYRWDQAGEDFTPTPPEGHFQDKEPEVTPEGTTEPEVTPEDKTETEDKTDTEPAANQEAVDKLNKREPTNAVHIETDGTPRPMTSLMVRDDPKDSTSMVRQSFVQNEDGDWKPITGVKNVLSDANGVPVLPTANPWGVGDAKGEDDFQPAPNETPYKIGSNFGNSQRIWHDQAAQLLKDAGFGTDSKPMSDANEINAHLGSDLRKTLNGDRIGGWVDSQTNADLKAIFNDYEGAVELQNGKPTHNARALHAFSHYGNDGQNLLLSPVFEALGIGDVNDLSDDELIDRHKTPTDPTETDPTAPRQTSSGLDDQRGGTGGRPGDPSATSTPTDPTRPDPVEPEAGSGGTTPPGDGGTTPPPDSPPPDSPPPDPTDPTDPTDPRTIQPTPQRDLHTDSIRAKWEDYFNDHPEAIQRHLAELHTTSTGKLAPNSPLHPHVGADKKHTDEDWNDHLKDALLKHIVANDGTKVADDFVKNVGGHHDEHTSEESERQERKAKAEQLQTDVEASTPKKQQQMQELLEHLAEQEKNKPEGSRRFHSAKGAAQWYWQNGEHPNINDWEADSEKAHKEIQAKKTDAKARRGEVRTDSEEDAKTERGHDARDAIEALQNISRDGNEGTHAIEEKLIAATKLAKNHKQAFAEDRNLSRQYKRKLKTLSEYANRSEAGRAAVENLKDELDSRGDENFLNDDHTQERTDAHNKAKEDHDKHEEHLNAVNKQGFDHSSFKHEDAKDGQTFQKHDKKYSKAYKNDLEAGAKNDKTDAEIAQDRIRRGLPPGPAPRPGLEWHKETHRWVNPDIYNDVGKMLKAGESVHIADPESMGLAHHVDTTPGGGILIDDKGNMYNASAAQTNKYGLKSLDGSDLAHNPSEGQHQRSIAAHHMVANGKHSIDQQELEHRLNVNHVVTGLDDFAKRRKKGALSAFLKPVALGAAVGAIGGPGFAAFGGAMGAALAFKGLNRLRQYSRHKIADKIKRDMPNMTSAEHDVLDAYTGRSSKLKGKVGTALKYAAIGSISPHAAGIMASPAAGRLGMRAARAVGRTGARVGSAGVQKLGNFVTSQIEQANKDIESRESGSGEE